MPSLKSHNKRVHARHVSRPEAVTTPSVRPRKVTIGKLSDEVLLDIFRYYLDASPQYWPRLVHICRNWRRLVFASQRALHLRLFCTHGTPVMKTLDCWPVLPIVVQYEGSLALGPPAPEDEDNIMAALKHSDRVSSIGLIVSSSLLEKLSAIETPFSELEDLVLLSQKGVQLILPSASLLGPRLRCLHLTRIAFPSLLQLLYSSRNLVDLQLHEVLNPFYLSPAPLTVTLSGMVRLQSLSLHFLSTANYLTSHPLSKERIVLPTLTRLDFRGPTEYLEELMARINAPRLGDIEVTFFGQLTFDLSKLRKFIDRIEIHKSHRRAHILSSEHAVSISLIQPGTPMRLKLQSFCEPLSEQLSSMARICTHFSALLSNVEDLRISAMRSSRRKGSLETGRWLEVVNFFTSVKWFHVTGNLSTYIVRALQQPNRRRKTVLPALYKLYIPHPRPRHAPLKGAVVSFMTSCRLSGHPIGVEYERPSRISELRGTGPVSQQATIEMLSDDVLLIIFIHRLDGSPQYWPTLVHVCQRWRQIVLKSPLGLDLRLYCTYGTPVLKTLDYWPPFPLVVKYGGSPVLNPPTPEDEENIAAALKRSDRVSSISLTVTNSLLKNISTISEPFSELEELVLLSRDSVQLTLPSTFRWGLRLRTLYSTRIAIPSFPRLLSPSHDLVDLQLHEIPSAGYFSPDAFANALSEITQLQTLSLHFLSLPPRRNYFGLPPPPGERVVLPALTCLKYRGTSIYLDSLVARIDAPRLGDIDITFFTQPTLDASQLGRFIDRIEILKSHCEANIRASENAVSISFTNSSIFTPLRLQISCKQLDWQLSSMAQICDQFSPFLFRVATLGINMTRSSSEQGDLGEGQWLELVRSFGGAIEFRVAGELTTDILWALCSADGGHTTVLPALRSLLVHRPVTMDEPLRDVLQSFIVSRSLSGRPVQVNAPSYQCHICRASFRQQQELKRHLGAEHAYRIVCSYCGDFECTQVPNDLFREHLESKHPEVVRNDALILDPFSRHFLRSELDRFVDRHNSLRRPYYATPSTMVTAPHSQ